MNKQVIKKEFIGILPVYSTNVEQTGNYVSEGNIINKNCLIDNDYQRTNSHKSFKSNLL
jgi:hypothetical protein